MLKKIYNIFKRNPCKKCIVKACCINQCNDYKIYSKKYDIILAPLITSMFIGIMLFIMIPISFIISLLEQIGVIKLDEFKAYN